MTSLGVKEREEGTAVVPVLVGSKWEVRMASSYVRGPGYSESDSGAIPYSTVYEGKEGYLFSYDWSSDDEGESMQS